ncbi:polysaccharide deacetylase family protein [Oscillibacter valericigenes]|uniref:polysaccharide deacetylase family protein n=1 Tax=Oscillibacter valericigenes TaxID=351091 RepID=UPI001F2BFA15|nr:polysaccharide deacetylase family protein [Oscillibacter valericigenes]MCF2663135.1 polysaccharide deacetylase family protein [Oscillibacter valericigenes]
MKKKLTALLCCALLVFQLAAPPRAQAAGYVYFVAAGENVLPLSDATMPFWHGGYLYIASSIFTGIARDALDIGRSRNDKDKLVVLYSGSRAKSLWFEWEKTYAHDVDGNVYHPGAIYRNGEVYVPVSLVARFFDLQYSVNKVNSRVNGELIQGDLAWIRRPGNILTDKYFMDAASSVITNRYEAYLKDKEKEQQGASTPGSSQTPAGVDIEGKRIYLCMTAGANTSALLDTLDRYGAQAAFFCTPEFLEQQGDLLRRMTATGQTIAILADAGDETRTVEEQLEAGNRALERATCGRTRLVRVENGDEQTFQRLGEAGYRCLEPDLDRSGYDLRSASNADSLLRRVLSYRGDDVTVWAADRADALGLRYFLADTESGDGRCLAWTETT